MKRKIKSIESDPAVPAIAPIWIAHRGDMQCCPENTLIALESAFTAGAQWIEFDVQLSRDGVPFLLHDEGLERTSGIDQYALDIGWIELSLISVHEPQRLGASFRGEKIPSLQNVVALLEQYPDRQAFVELKTESIEHFGMDVVVSRIMSVLQPVLSRCAIISFDRGAVQLARENGAPAIGWVLREWSSQARRETQVLAPDYLFCNHKRLPDQEMLWEGPWEWVLYDVMDVELALSLLRRGVRYLETGNIGGLVTNDRLRPGAVID